MQQQPINQRIQQFRNNRSHIVSKLKSDNQNSEQQRISNIIRDTLALSDSLINDLYSILEVAAAEDLLAKSDGAKYHDARETLDRIYACLWMGFGLSKETLFSVMSELSKKKLI